ncbi:MAG: LytR C-terminal domain-containing protein [Frankiaceae bacterium]|nr:LytR C-terminal domain-containing protein [Frankiaceae bacterium]
MTEGGSPWNDPAGAVGFRAAYEPYVPRPKRSVPGEEPVQEPVAEVVEDVPAAPNAVVPPATRAGRPRAEQPGHLPPSRALAGAAVAVAGVALGIVTLLWLSDDPSQGPGPVVIDPVSAGAQMVDPFAARQEGETAPVDPPAVVEAPAAPVAPPVAEPAPVAPSVVVPVTVLNNSRITGLADRGAQQFEAAGWPVAETGNHRGRIRATTVYYPAGLEASAREFASRFPGVERVLPRPENLPGSGLTAVLTRDFSS